MIELQVVWQPNHIPTVLVRQTRPGWFWNYQLRLTSVRKIMPSKNVSEGKTVNVISKWQADCYVFPLVHSDIPCSQTEKVLPSVSNQEQTLQVCFFIWISSASRGAHSAMLRSLVLLCTVGLNKSPTCFIMYLDSPHCHLMLNCFYHWKFKLTHSSNRRDCSLILWIRSPYLKRFQSSFLKDVSKRFSFISNSIY